MSNSKHYKNKGISRPEPVKMAFYDNRQTYIKKKCKECGHTFVSKKLGGYEKCRKCNNKWIPVIDNTIRPEHMMK